MDKRVTLEPPSAGTVMAARHLDINEGPVRVGSTVDQATRSAITQVVRYVAKAHGTEPDQSQDQLKFVTRVMEIFSLSHADVYGDLFWRVDDGQISLYANVSDIFFWGGYDVEQITWETLPELERAYLDLKAVEAEEFTSELYAARIRQMRPQGAAYPSDTHDSWRRVVEFYNACGPERAIDVGNPKKPPVI